MTLPDFWNNRRADTHKGDYGHALLVAGSYGKMGCAILAARACMRSGVGLLSVHLPEQGLNPIQCAVPEAMTSLDADPMLFSHAPRNLEKYDALAVGPGIGTADRTYLALKETLMMWGDNPLVLDADALNIMAIHRDELLPLIKDHAVITPHDGEYRRLFGDGDPAEMSAKYGIVIVRKGFHSRVYAPDGSLYVNTTGNPGMSTAGSGDVLTGILLALLAQGMVPYEAACLAVFLHGEAGDIAAQNQPQATVIASDIIENLRRVSEKV